MFGCLSEPVESTPRDPPAASIRNVFLGLSARMNDDYSRETRMGQSILPAGASLYSESRYRLIVLYPANFLFAIQE